MDTMRTEELISALADGQLAGEAFARGVELAAADPAARQAWQTYHLIGDVLRSGEQAAGALPAEFLGRLQARLRQEQVAAPGGAAAAGPVREPAQAAANDASFRWKLVAGFASLAAVTAIGWMAVGGLGAKPEQAQLAGGASAGTVLAETQRGVMIRDARLDEFLAAHRQLGGASALQMPAGFLRNATFEGPVR
ncbi:MAG: sigma-E factor negative regulatory protein [Ramlibacter sp.]|nr:sigma-E factor negative regulatory protein [Ramlibacter sp.]